MEDGDEVVQRVLRRTIDLMRADGDASPELVDDLEGAWFASLLTGVPSRWDAEREIAAVKEAG